MDHIQQHRQKPRDDIAPPKCDLTPRHFRTAMGSFLTGVTIITTSHKGAQFGMTANSLTSVSADPCQLLVCINHDSSAGNAIRNSGRFIVNILAEHQKDVAMHFARPSQGDRFAGVDHAIDRQGLPYFKDALCSVECALDRTFKSGDHEIFIGSAVSCHVNDGNPLVFFRGDLDLSLNLPKIEAKTC